MTLALSGAVAAVAELSEGKTVGFRDMQLHRDSINSSS